MNKPRAIGLIEGTIDGLVRIVNSAYEFPCFSPKGAIENLREAIKLLESDDNYQNMEISRKLVVGKTCRGEIVENKEI